MTANLYDPNLQLKIAEEDLSRHEKGSAAGNIQEEDIISRRIVNQSFNAVYLRIKAVFELLVVIVQEHIISTTNISTVCNNIYSTTEAHIYLVDLNSFLKNERKLITMFYKQLFNFNEQG